MIIQVQVHEDIAPLLRKKRDDLHDFVTVENFRIVDPEVRKAIIAKLLMLDEGKGQA